MRKVTYFRDKVTKDCDFLPVRSLSLVFLLTQFDEASYNIRSCSMERSDNKDLRMAWSTACEEHPHE